ncbi:MAG: FAD-linked oxidase C-terminal domain-containing protein [Thermoanaerobaculia bacterium]
MEEGTERRALTPAEILALREIVGAAHVLVLPDDLEPYAHDWTEDFIHVPAAAVRPRSTAEVSRVLALCNERAIPVTPQGGRTGLSGGALALHGGVALSLDRMDTILEIDRANLVVIVEAGVITQRVHEAVEEQGLSYPPDPASRGSCTIGGNVAENAGGPHAAKYGVTGKWVLGLEAVLADGSVLVTGGKTRKDVAGFDLTALLVGSEGTLAVVTKAWLRLMHRPTCWATLIAPFGTLEQAARCVVALHDAGLVPAACEIVDRPAAEVSSRRKGESLPFPEAEARLLIEFDGAADAEVEREATLAGEIALECGALDVVLATDEAKRRRLWEIRRGIGEAVRELGPSAELDLGVPRTALVSLVESVRRISAEAGLAAVSFGHASDGNLHVHLYRDVRGGSAREIADIAREGHTAPGAAHDEADAVRFGAATRAIYAAAAALGGTVTGEHGVGITSREHLSLCRSRAYIDALRAIKRALDPLGILNPGKLIPSPPG